MRLHRFVVAIPLLSLLAASCGGGGTEEAAPTPTCTTVTPGPDGSPTPTPTPCLLGATGASPSAEPTGEPVGESWRGTASITSSAAYPEGDTCQDGWELQFTFVASADGTIEGQGTAVLTTPPTCTFPINDVPSFADVEYQVLGYSGAGGFSLRFALATSGFSADEGGSLGGFSSIFSVPASPSGGPPVSVAVSGTSGTGRGAWQYETTATYSANGTIMIECVASCEPAP